MTTEKKVYRAIGLMSGTSLDGVDCALIETDGHGYVKPLGFITEPYDDDLRDRLRGCFGQQDAPSDVVRDMTLAHAAIVKKMGESADVMGFHGQTIYHAPDDGVTVQIGDGALLAAETGMDVVCDMRSADVAAGGQGAPLAPAYHMARILSAGVELPVAILNIGGVGNVTYIDEKYVLAFDTGPGNALMDDFVQKHTGARFDEGGKLALSGAIRSELLECWLEHSYFKELPPKSLDRDEWDVSGLDDGVSIEDGLATLQRFTVESILQSRNFMKESPKAWYACGGGRHNKGMMAALSEELPMHSVDELGWDGDATEAECFGYLAVRSLLGEPLSFPGTTGVGEALSGGVLFEA